MTELRQRDPRQVDRAFLIFVRKQYCCICGAYPPVQAAHIRMASIARGKRETGTGERPHDKWSVPACSECHLDNPVSIHKMGEKTFWDYVELDPFQIASELYTEFQKTRQ